MPPTLPQTQTPPTPPLKQAQTTPQMPLTPHHPPGSTKTSLSKCCYNHHHHHSFATPASLLLSHGLNYLCSELNDFLSWLCLLHYLFGGGVCSFVVYLRFLLDKATRQHQHQHHILKPSFTLLITEVVLELGSTTLSRCIFLRHCEQTTSASPG